MTDDSKINGHANLDSEKSPAGLGFSTWQRHTSASLATRNGAVQRREGGLLPIYNRHSSFAAALIARQFNQGASGTGAAGFVFRSGQYRRPWVMRGMGDTDRSETQLLLPKRFPPDDTISRAAGRGDMGNIECNESAGGVQEISILRRETPAVAESPPSPPGLPAIGQERSIIHRSLPVSTVSAAAHGRLGKRSSPSSPKVARKITLSGSSQLPAGSIKTDALSQHIADLQTRHHLPLMRLPITPGPMPAGRRLQGDNLGKVEYTPALAYHSPGGQPAFTDAIGRKSVASDLPKAKSETKSAPRQALADGSPAESRPAGMAGLNREKPSPTNTSSPGNTQPGNSVSMSPVPVDYVLRRPAEPSSASSAARGNATIIGSDSGRTSLPLQRLRTPSRQPSTLSSQELRLKVPLHPATPSHLIATSRLAHPALPLSQPLPAGRALPRQPLLQRKQIHGKQSPLPGHGPSALSEMPLQQSASGGPDLAPASVTRTTISPTGHAIPRADSSPTPNIPEIPEGKSGFDTRITLNPAVAQRLADKAGLLTMRRKAIPIHAPIERSGGPVSVTGSTEPPLRVLPTAPPLSQTFKLSRSTLHRHEPLEAMADHTHTSFRIARQDSSSALPQLPRTTAPESGTVTEHHAKPANSYIFRRAAQGDQAPSDALPTGVSSSSIRHMAGTHSHETIMGNRRLTSVKPLYLQANRISAAAAAHIRPMPHSLYTISRLSGNAPPSSTSTAAQRLPGNSDSTPLAFPYPISRRIASVTTGRPAAMGRMGTVNATGGVTAENDVFRGQLDAISSQGTNSSSSHSTSSYNNGTPSFTERPLARIQRSNTDVMRVPERTTDVIQTSALPEDRYGVVSPAESAETRVLPEQAPSGSAPKGPDPEEIAEQAWRMIAERLVIEQERRGLTRWP